MIRLLWAGFIKGISLCLGICVYVAICVICVYSHKDFVSFNYKLLDNIFRQHNL